ncbi:hypothetical protein QCA50_021027 [Cerrena zonata]|uniref:Uncharacterized protein n=1 Tax=Cerrena zonata TaxID=2478898 RepID=A0AAW0F891_9APHY
MPPIRKSLKSTVPQKEFSVSSMTVPLLRAEARNTLNAQYRKILGREDVSVPWTWPWEGVWTHRVILIGYPLEGKLTDPCMMNKEHATVLVEALRRGTCFFAKIGKEELQELAEGYAEAVKSGDIVPKPLREDRADKGSTHGRHKNPATRTKKRRRGKIINSPAVVRDDTDIEDFTEEEGTTELSSDPISDWSD